MAVKIAIKELANFVCQSGDLSLEFTSNYDLQQGKKAHQYLQSKYNADSKKEYYIKQTFSYQGKEILLHGFIDGVLKEGDQLIIEEIKSTITDLDEVDFTKHQEYLAQLKCYGYLYALQQQLSGCNLRLTFISSIDYTTKSQTYYHTVDELETFVFSLLEAYLIWLSKLEEANQNKVSTLASVVFPYEQMRPGQKDMMKACFKTMKEKKILYCVAPTGIGKTMATIFASLKTLKANDKLFYLTAKGVGKEAPLKAMRLLKQNGLKLKTIVLTAKKKICNAQKRNCNFEECPYAIGFFDRLKNATMDLFSKADIYDEANISRTAETYRICAFEFSLYLSYFCDMVIADYNYAFDPKAHLIRYFDDDTYSLKLLVDEAHNLVSRSKEMYSAMLSEEDIRTLRRSATSLKPSIRKTCNQLLELFSSYREKATEKAVYISLEQDLDFVMLVKNLLHQCDRLKEENKTFPRKEDFLESYFKLLDYQRIADYYSVSHRFFVKIEDDIVSVQLMCLDASSFILDTIENSCGGVVFFSATLQPFDYYAHLITQGKGNCLQLPSPFPPQNLNLIINNRISTKYFDRLSSVDYILEAIEALTAGKKGNYIVFFPSYQYLNLVVSAIEEADYEMIVQKNNIKESERMEILDRFKEKQTCKVGFFVLGGLFSEGIDFVGEELSGVIIVGVGLPLYGEENNLLKDYFEQLYHQGFDYAYTYPGFTKVVQAVGRVIRSETDRGVAVLLDERFDYAKYRALMPDHWQNRKIIHQADRLKKEIAAFFNEEK